MLAWTAVIVPTTLLPVPWASRTAGRTRLNVIARLSDRWRIDASISVPLVLGRRGRGGCLAALEEPFLLLGGHRFLGTPGVQPFHLLNLTRGDLWQVPDEMHELPGREVVVRGCFRSPGRHSREPNAVLDGVEDLA